jgi:transcriptional regulator with XRE-family HTH domain
MTFGRTFQVRLGRNMRIARVEGNLTREQVAERMLPPVKEPTVRSWEMGDRAVPTVRLVDYCRVVGRPVAAVIPTDDGPAQVIHAPRLVLAEDPKLQPLAAWARGYGRELIRLTPEAIAVAAELCRVKPEWLRRRLLKMQRF